MPVHVNKLSPSVGTEFTFIDIQGSPDPRGEQLEIFARPGYDGVVARKTGSRGDPFSIRTVAYWADFATAKAALALYKAAIGTDPWELWRYSVSYGTFLILKVREVECRAMVNSTAGAYTVRTVHEWELLG